MGYLDLRQNSGMTHRALQARPEEIEFIGRRGSKSHVMVGDTDWV
jgi:hypothetical protein